MHLEPVDVEGGLGGELLLAVRTLPRRARVAQHGLAAASGLGLSRGRLLAGHRRRGQLDIDIADISRCQDIECVYIPGCGACC